MVNKFIILGIVACVTLNCSRQIELAGPGTGSDTPNSLSGCIVYPDGKAAEHAIVRLRPAEYFKDTALIPVQALQDVYTDKNGLFTIDSVDTGKYTIEVNKNDSQGVLIRCHLVSDSTLQTETLKPTGMIQGTLVTSVSGVNARYVQVRGLDRLVVIDSLKETFVITNLPPGLYSLRVIYSSPENKACIFDSIPIVSGQITERRFTPWKFSRRIVLNTTTIGADVSGDVVNFPVLVRLTATTFDFSEAATDGADIRFTTSGGAPLAFEIERWDPVAELAEVWVKVDTVYGNDSMQAITMYWGNPDASLRSASGRVFDTADGFQGVWHMSDAADDSICDATVNRYHGGSPDTARPSATEGVIGNCREFDGVDDYVTMPGTAEGKLNFPQYGYYTVSAWIFIDTFSITQQLIVSKGYEQYFLWTANYPAGSPFWEFNEFNENTNWESVRTPAAGGQWVLLTGVRQGEKQFLYCNGVLVDSVKDVWSYEITRDTLNDLSIGGFLEEIYDPSYKGYCFFRGSIDEVRVISAAQGSDWIRLCYMNQRIDDRLVIFK